MRFCRPLSNSKRQSSPDSWHVEAAKRAQRACFDIVYVYAAHWYLLRQFLDPSNQRSDE